MRKSLIVFLLLLIIIPIHFSKPTLADWTPPFEVKYHSYSEVSALILQLNSSPYVDVRIIGTSYNGSPIYAVRISTDLTTHKPAIFRIFGQHAREYITTETALFLMYYLDAVLKGSVSDENVTALLTYFDVYIIPCANPDGHDIAMFHNEWQRKNVHPIDEDGDGLVDEDPPEDINGDGYIDIYYSSMGVFKGAEGIDNDGDGMSGEDRIGGVDLNRNRPRDRGEPASNASETYPGTKPLSEPESRAIYEFVKSLGPVALFDIHSGIKALLYPPGTEYGSTTLQTIYSKMSLLAIKLGRQAMVSVSLYPAYGTLEDTGYFDIHAVSITLEIFGNVSRPKYEQMSNGDYRAYGVKRMFNPMPSKLLDTMRDAARMILGCSYIVYEYSRTKTDVEVRTNVYNDTLSIVVKPNDTVVREAFALLIGNNFTRYIPLVDHLDHTIVGSINLNTAGLKDGTYALIVFVHGVLRRNAKAYVMNLSGYFQDSDHDGIDDDREYAWNVMDPSDDNDHDGLTNLQEYLIGSNPDNADSDFDGLNDSFEYSIALLAVFRGSGFDNLGYELTKAHATFMELDNGVFVEAVGGNRSIEIHSSKPYFGSNDVAFAEYSEDLAIVVHADGKSRLYTVPGVSSTTSGKESFVPYVVIAVVIAVVVILLARFLRKR